MKIFTLHRKQSLPIDLATAWDFFSNPKNLEKITPPYLNLKPTSDIPNRTYQGMIITYRVKPFIFPQTWVTEIKEVNEPYSFIDEQRFGPYKFWHHQHKFESIEDGVMMTDLVHYALPFDPFSRVMIPIVKKQLDSIFDYRNNYLKQLFQK